MLLDFRKPRVAVVDKFISWSGKYFCFLGNHYHSGHTCWVFGSSNKETGEIVMRHYSTASGSIAPKAECETEWRKFKEKMLAKPQSEITDDSHIPLPHEREVVRSGGHLRDLLKRAEKTRPN